MRSTRLLRVSTFRLTLVYLGLFVLSALALLVFVYVSSVRFMDSQTVETIEVEIAGLIEQHAERGFDGLRRAVRIRAADETGARTALPAARRGWHGESRARAVGFAHGLPPSDRCRCAR